LKDKDNNIVCHLLYEEFPRDPRVRRYVNALNEKNIKCIIVCSKKKKDKYFELWKGNPVYRIPVSKHRQSFILTFVEYSLFTLMSFFVLPYLGIKYRFKILHIHTLPDTLIFAALFNKIFGAKLILDLHELFPELFIVRKPGLRNSLWVKILRLSESCSIKTADALITIHEPAKDIFLGRHKGIENKMNVIMNAVDPDEFKTYVPVRQDSFVIMYNGTVVKILNLELIIKCLHKLHELMPSADYDRVKFIIYGDGPALPGILKLAEDLGVSEKVVYKGLVSPHEMSKHILEASVCILPPLKNLYSDLFYTVKLVEMVYLHIPVIATRLNTYKYYYREESLFYFDSGNVEQLTEQLTEVFYNKELVATKTKNAYEDYMKVNWNIMQERYYGVIQSMLK
jgi:glycosyltransferase involved in cell wall biosynthesis